MLIEFRVGNYRSFKDTVTLSMVASNINSHSQEIDNHNVFAVDDELKLLKSAAIYGANASGKSNLAKAISFMKWFMINSSKETQSTEKIGVEPFELNTDTKTAPSFFEIVFLLDGKKYRYGFEATQERVISEWLFYVPTSKETRIFARFYDGNSDKMEYLSKRFKGEGIHAKTRHNALFISVAAQFNVKIAQQILELLTQKLHLISGLEDKKYLAYTIKCLSADHENRESVINLIKKLDLGIREISLEETEVNYDSLPKDIPEELKRIILKTGAVKSSAINTFHQKFDHQGNYVELERFNLQHHESEGTQKIVALAGALVDTLKNGQVLIFDEFDARLHPLISKAIVRVFNSQETNYNHAQLIFMTHDTNLLSSQLFRRDQIWFTEKNKYGATDLYSLVEYKIKNDHSYERDYINGKYGAIPFIGNLTEIIGVSHE